MAGKTLYISGASRGIGKAIALKAAQDGAKVVIAAKTATAHPKLPGTIYTAAEESKFKFTYPAHFLLYKLSIFSFSVKLIYVLISLKSCMFQPKNSDGIFIDFLTGVLTLLSRCHKLF